MTHSPDPLAVLESSIRRQVQADSFVETTALLDLYLKELDRTLRAAPHEVMQLYNRAMVLLEWTGQMAQASREDAYRQATHLQTLAGYRGIPNSPPNVRTDA